LAKWRHVPNLWPVDVSYLEKQKRWQCKSRHSKRQFSVKPGTIFEDSALGLERWLPALWTIIDGFWNLFKRSYKGTYTRLSPTHLDMYVKEHTYRYNTRCSATDNDLQSALRIVIGG
jgi:hypothetical protein